MSVAISTDRGGDAAASCPCLFVSLERPRVATENGRGEKRRPSGINGRENECHLFRNTHPEDSRRCRWEIHGNGYAGEGWRNSMTDGGAKIFRRRVTRQFFNVNESAVRSLLRYALSYSFLWSSSRANFFIHPNRKSFFLFRIFISNELIVELWPRYTFSSDNKMIIFILYLYMHMLDDKVRSNLLSFCNYVLAMYLYSPLSFSLSLSLRIYRHYFEKDTTFHGRHKIRNVLEICRICSRLNDI